MKKYILLFLLMFSALQPQMLCAKQVFATQEELAERGKALRASIEAARNRSTASHDDITDIVVKYIPLGTAFDDARTILRAADIPVTPHPARNVPGNRPNEYDVIGAIDPLDTKPPCRVSVYIDLIPKAPGDYGKITKVSASMVKNCW